MPNPTAEYDGPPPLRIERQPADQTLLVAWPDEALERVAPDSSTAVVVLTHDDKFDLPALKGALETEAFYIGALGSKKTHAARQGRLARAGFSPEEIARVNGPVGLSIGALSPAEIAVSILAQITAIRRQA